MVSLYSGVYNYGQKFGGGSLGAIFIICSLFIGIGIAWRTQKIYAGEWKIRVRIPKKNDTKRTWGCFTRWFRGYDWKDGEILGVHDDGKLPTFRVAFNNVNEDGEVPVQVDDVPLKNLRLLQQKGLYKKMRDGVSRYTY